MAANSLAYILPRIEEEDLEFSKYLNFLLALMERRRRSEIVNARPFEVTIDPSTVCQLSCPHCEVGNQTIRRGRSLLRPEVHDRMLGALGPEVFLAWYFSTGEPLLNKKLPQIVSQTRGKGIFPILSTNLSLALSDHQIDELLRCGFGIICVSLDGASPETYRRYRVGGDFSLVVENMRRLVTRRRQLGLEYPLIEWRFLVFRHNQHEIGEARRLASEYGVDLLEFFPGYAPPSAAADEVQVAVDADLSPSVCGPAIDAARKRRDTTLHRLLRAGPSASSQCPTSCDIKNATGSTSGRCSFRLARWAPAASRTTSPTISDAWTRPPRFTRSGTIRSFAKPGGCSCTTSQTRWCARAARTGTRRTSSSA